jgi:predicted GNAT superfamily acetyltransferase
MFRAFNAATDTDVVLAINNSCVPEVGELDAAKLDILARGASFFQVAVSEQGEVLGGLVGLDENAAEYKSPNYRYFCDRHSSLAYVDRVFFAESARNKGLGSALYQAFFDWASHNSKPVVCAEVNTIPDNPGSHRFHQRAGFIEVGRLRPYAPDKEVAMYERPTA